MPYIKLERRKELDPAIKNLIAVMRASKASSLSVVDVLEKVLVQHEDQINPNWDQAIDALISEQALGAGRTRGDLNYTMCRVILGVGRPESGWSYTFLSEAIAVCSHLEVNLREQGFPIIPIEVCRDVAHELRRRLLDPYEDLAILKNGDLPEIEREDFRQEPGEYLRLDVCGNPMGRYQ